MEGFIWFGLGFLAATYMFHQGFKGYINQKIGRKKKKKEDGKDKDDEVPTRVG